MRTRMVMLTLMLLLLIACNNDDGPQSPSPDSQNRPPNNFDLLEVGDKETGIDVLPTFSWEQATDHDGDAITYEVYVDTVPEPSLKVASGLTTTTFQLSERLHLLADYRWKVIAKDGKGGETQSVVRTFTTRDIYIPDSPVTQTPDFPARRNYSTAAFNNRLWVIGGYDGNTNLNDIWTSTDGVNWEEVKPNTSFSVRENHTATVFHNRLWILGGSYGNSNSGDVLWHSSDGIVWKEVAPSSPLKPRSGHATSVFKDALWVNGCYNCVDNIMYSSDGTNWMETIPNAEILGRYGHSAAVYDEKLWVIGGRQSGKNKNDVWYTTDGNTWTRIEPNGKLFTERSEHATVVFDNKLWVIGGNQSIPNGSENKNDIWYTEDGSKWTEIPTPPNFILNAGHTATVFNDKLWIVTGAKGSEKNKIWVLN